MKKCKIEVIKKTFNEELAKEYGCPGIGPCPFHQVGQVYYGDCSKPEGFCDDAWRAIFQYVFALANGSGKFYFNDWIEKEGVAIACCNDGLRPVIFKIERTAMDSTPNQTALE